MPNIALITWAQFPPPPLLTRPGLQAQVHGIDMYDLPGTDLAAFDALLIGTGADQRVLAEQRGRLQSFLEAGGAIVFCGHIAYPFLDGLAEFVPLARYRVEDLMVAPAAPHNVFDGVDPQQLTFRRGVAGFYGRGHNPPPPGAVVLNVLGPARVPVDWVRHYGRHGVLLVHAGNDLWGYLPEQEGGADLPARLDRWITQRSEQRLSLPDN